MALGYIETELLAVNDFEHEMIHSAKFFLQNTSNNTKQIRKMLIAIIVPVKFTVSYDS